MKTPSFIILSLFSLGCQSLHEGTNKNESIYVIEAAPISSASEATEAYIAYADRFLFDESETFLGNSESVEFLYDNGQLKSTGKYAIDHKGRISEFQCGQWVEYHPNGIEKERGNYAFGRYLQCCAGGLCFQYYSYKIGYWEYHHYNGQLAASGTYNNSNLHLQTSCEGGDTLSFGLTSSSWIFQNMRGSSLPYSYSLKETYERAIDPSWNALYLVPDTTSKTLNWVETTDK